MAKILIVDDERNLLWLLEELLENYGHATFTAANGQAALRIVETELPDLIISDVMMPIMDGYTLLESIKLRPDWQHIKVVLVSAAAMRRDTPYLADAYIDKPYDLEAIEAAVERLLANGD